ncbi:MAG: alpha/beta fold hydrolase [Pseudomonadota bacterium]
MARQTGFDKHKLISAVYAATLSPDRFLTLMDDLDASLLGFEPSDDVDSRKLRAAEPALRKPPAVSTGDAVEIDPDLAYHINQAQNIQMRLGRGNAKEERLAMVLDAIPNPSFIVDGRGAVVLVNALTSSRFPQRFGRLSDVLKDKQALDAFERFAQPHVSRDFQVIAGEVALDRTTQTSVLVKRIDNPATMDADRWLYLVTLVDFGFDDTTTQSFQQAYSLTEAECDIAVRLASGRAPSDIATARGSSLQTVRTQIKSVKTKTGVQDIPSLVRLLCGFSSGIMVPKRLVGAHASGIGAERFHHEWKQITLRDGRTVSFLEQGASDGFPVLALHNMPYGVRLTEAANACAQRYGLRFISPYRAGYAASDPVKVNGPDGYLGAIARDNCELLDTLGIKRAHVLGHVVGSVHALRFARLFPNRVKGLFAVGKTPVWRREWLARTPKRQRLVMRLATHLPQLLPVLIWAMMVYIEKGHTGDLVIDAVADGEADLQALKDPEIFNLLETETVEAMNRTTSTFCLETMLCIQDFTEEARAAEHKFHAFHGEDDQIVKSFQSQVFADAVPGTKLEIVPGAGNFLLYSHWQAVLKALRNAS